MNEEQKPVETPQTYQITREKACELFDHMVQLQFVMTAKGAEMAMVCVRCGKII